METLRAALAMKARQTLEISLGGLTAQLVGERRYLGFGEQRRCVGRRGRGEDRHEQACRKQSAHIVFPRY